MVLVSKPSVVVRKLTIEYPKEKKKLKKEEKKGGKGCGTFFDVKIIIMMGETNEKENLDLEF